MTDSNALPPGEMRACEPQAAAPNPLETATQEQLVQFVENVLAARRHAHPKGTYERDAYEACLGLVLQHNTRSGRIRAAFGRWWKWLHTRRMNKARPWKKSREKQA